MSSGKKHRLEGEADEAQKVKKVKKVKTDDADAAATEEAPVKEKKHKKDKEGRKEKKDKKDKADKKEKKEKKRKRKEKELAEQGPQDDGNTTAAVPAGDVDVEAATEAPEPPTKEEKKAKKSKDKKSKKAKTEDEPAAPSPAPATGDSTKYQQSAALTAVPQAEIDAYLADNNITINPASALRPILKFDQLPPSRILSKDPFKAFPAPTPIQAASWPFSLSGRDVIGIAETGSGKTYAFSLPCIEALARLPNDAKEGSSSNKHGPVRARAVIVSPTRELAMQTHASISSLAPLAGLSAVCVYGGASKDEQRAQLRRGGGADVVVATPGRLKDFLSEGCVSLDEAVFVVLDEADRMLDKGFEEDIKEIIGGCPPRERRQTLMFTATWPDSVRGLAESFMVDPVKVIISRDRAGGEGGANGSVELQANSRIEQTVEVVDPRGKERRLLEILKENQRGKAWNDRILVFCLYKKETTRVEQFLESRGVKVAAIHGDLRQEQRTRSLEAFKSGTTTVLLATDVAARGLDIPEVKLVINLTVCWIRCA